MWGRPGTANVASWRLSATNRKLKESGMMPLDTPAAVLIALPLLGKHPERKKGLHGPLNSSRRRASSGFAASGELGPRLNPHLLSHVCIASRASPLENRSNQEWGL